MECKSCCANLNSSVQGLSKQLKEMLREVNLCRDVLGRGAGRLCGGDDRALMEDTLEGLQERMGLLDSALEQHCDGIRDRLQEHTTFQVRTLNPPSACSVKRYKLSDTGRYFLVY